MKPRYEYWVIERETAVPLKRLAEYRRFEVGARAMIVQACVGNKEQPGRM